MPKYLIQGSYTPDGIEGPIKEGFASRQQHITSLIQNLGGAIEAFYFAYGSDDVLGIADLSEEAAVALSLAVNRTGSVNLRTTPLLTAARMDAARGRLPDYRPPGH